MWIAHGKWLTVFINQTAFFILETFFVINKIIFLFIFYFIKISINNSAITSPMWEYETYCNTKSASLGCQSIKI